MAKIEEAIEKIDKQIAELLNKKEELQNLKGKELSSSNIEEIKALWKEVFINKTQHRHPSPEKFANEAVDNFLTYFNVSK